MAAPVISPQQVSGNQVRPDHGSRREHMSIKIKYLLITLFLAVILVIAGIIYNSTKIITEKTVESHQQSIVSEAAKTVELWLEQRLDIIEATAAAVQQITIAQDSQTLRLLKMAMKAGNFSDVYIGLADGTMIDGADWPPPKGYDPRIRPWYKTAVAENKIAFTTPYVDMTTNKMVIAIVKPLYVNNDFKGVISSDIILDTLEENVMNVKIGRSGYTFVIGSQGTVLIHPDQSLLMKTKIQEIDPSLHGILDYFKKSPSGSYYYTHLGKEKILSFKRLSNTGWYLCTTVQREEAYQLARNTAMLFAMEIVLKTLGALAILTLFVVSGSAFALLISRHRFRITVQKHNLLMSGKEKDLKGEIIRRKEVEARYQTLFNVATNAILLSKHFSYIECNEKAMDLFGYDLEGIIGKSMLDLSPAIQQDGQESKIKFDKIISSVIAGEQKFFKWTFQRSNGKEFPAKVSIQMLQLDKEMVILSSIWDISKQADAEHQLIQAQKMAAMGEMLSAIAHQWRQPLNALSAYISSLPSAFYNQMLTKEFIEKLVKEADSQIQFMSRTINDFRQYFLPSKTKQHFDLFDSIHSAVKLINPQLKQKAISLQIYDREDKQQLFVFGYKNEFVHVLVNIISNAKDAIEDKQKDLKKGNVDPRIDLFVTTRNGYVSLAVSDNGCGVPEQLLTKIFTPYFTTKGTATGTGIGLYMAKTIVEKEMDGSIFVENKKDGATFVIRLPLSDIKGTDHA